MEWCLGQLNDDCELFCNYNLLNNKSWVMIIKKYMDDYWTGKADGFNIEISGYLNYLNVGQLRR
jgi:hypothetical protein